MGGRGTGFWKSGPNGVKVDVGRDSGGDQVADLKVTFDFVSVSRGLRGRFLSNPVELPVIVMEGVVCTSGELPR